MMAGRRSRHFTAVTAVGPLEVELEHSSFMCCLEFPHKYLGGAGGVLPR